MKHLYEEYLNVYTYSYSMLKDTFINYTRNIIQFTLNLKIYEIKLNTALST